MTSSGQLTGKGTDVADAVLFSPQAIDLSG